MLTEIVRKRDLKLHNKTEVQKEDAARQGKGNGEQWESLSRKSRQIETLQSSVHFFSTSKDLRAVVSQISTLNELELHIPMSDSEKVQCEHGVAQ